MRAGARVLALIGVLVVPDELLAQEQSRGFLTAPRTGDPVTIALDHVRARRSELSLAPDDLGDTVTHQYRSRRSDTTHVRVRQRLRGIEVVNGDLTVAVRADGRLLHRRSRFVSDLARRANTTVPVLTAAQAVALGALDRGLPEVGALEATGPANGPARAREFQDSRISLDPIPAKLMLLPLDDGAVRLIWHTVLRAPEGSHWWSLYVDAATGEVLRANDWIDHDSYNVFGLNLESPSDGARSIVNDPADATASPFGWHDTNGATGAEFTDTRGNNVSAQDDLDGNNAGGTRPDGGVALDFNSALDLNLVPGTYTAAATENLFYWNNLLHDIFYQYGFDEASGNFQENNYGNGGAAGDPVQADAQDGSSTNNADFGTPPDGFDPRMQMFIWTGASQVGLTVNTPVSIAGDYSAGNAEFGEQACGGLTGDVVAALDVADVAGPTTTDGCSAFTNAGAVAGNIALIDRGECLFVEKVQNAEAAGATGVIIANNVGVNDTLTMGGTPSSPIGIASIFIGQSDGATIRGELPGVNATLTSCLQNRDSSFDNGIITHEYAHGISNRLTGGASNVDCLDNAQSGGMGEGWGDFFGLVLTAKAGAQSTDARGIGTYVLGEPPSGPGIRSHPYSTNLAVNPLTFSDLASLGGVHGRGTLWAATLWEMYWELVDKHGWDPDLYAGTGGNNLSLQLVIDGMKLQTCNPTFLEARDAILDADTNLNAGANHCQIWTAFAKRGMGDGASTPNSSSTTTTENFTLPVGICADLCSGVTCTALDACHTVGTCDPGTGVCSDPNATAGTACGDPSTTECSAPDTCDGAGTCAPNHSNGATSCTDDGLACTNDLCDGGGNCAHATTTAGTECRAANGACDVVENCDGIATSCPTDAFVTPGENCGDGPVECSGQDTCDGAGSCAPNHSAPGSACQDPLGQCTLADACDGSGTCNDNGIIANGTSCDDGNPATESDQCLAGSCTGSLSSALPAASPPLLALLAGILILLGMILLGTRSRA